MKKLRNISIFLFLFTLSGCYSCQSWNDMWGNGPVEPGCEEKFFFDKDCQLIAKAEPAPKPVAPKPRPVKPKPVPVSKCGASTVSMGYPCDACTIIQLNKTMPTEVLINEPFNYTIKATNVTDTTVVDVMVTENIPANLSIKNANPAATKQGGKLVWKLGTFAPKQSKTITVSGMATNTDCVKTCAAVIYVIPACASVQVVQPKLQLTKTAPAEVLLCDPIPVKFTVTNSGTGSVQNVKVVDSLPEGLKTTDGKSKLVFDAGTLAAGQSKRFSATLRASKTGKYVNEALAGSPSGLKAEAKTTTIVRQPVLTISKTGPSKRYLGRSVAYEITVTNKGDAPARDLVIQDQLPSGVKFVSASNGGKASAGKVQWNLSSLPAGKSAKLTVTVMPVKAGTITNSVVATATCAEGVRASVKTSIAGIPAILLEVIDVIDPIEIGGQTTYVITATNQGSAPGTNISIVCNLEANEQYVSSTGATKGTLAGSTLTFTPLRSLAPKAKATWRVIVKAVKEGDVRFKVTMNTDQLTRPVEETEATHLYK